MLQTRIMDYYAAEQHVYGIPLPGVIASVHWTQLTNERRVHLRTRALTIWKDYLETEGKLISHPPILVPEYREMLTHPDGDLIVEEAA